VLLPERAAADDECRPYGVLPPYDAVVLDEAHTIEDVASDYFGLSLSRFQVTYLVSRLYHARRNKGLLATLQRKLDAPLFNGCAKRTR